MSLQSGEMGHDGRRFPGDRRRLDLSPGKQKDF